MQHFKLSKLISMDSVTFCRNPKEFWFVLEDHLILIGESPQKCEIVSQKTDFLPW